MKITILVIMLRQTSYFVKSWLFPPRVYKVQNNDGILLRFTKEKNDKLFVMLGYEKCTYMKYPRILIICDILLRDFYKNMEIFFLQVIKMV